MKLPIRSLLVTLLTVSVLVPHVALASWWNPFSWFKSDNSQKVDLSESDNEKFELQKKIKDLEYELSIKDTPNISTTTPTTTIAAKNVPTVTQPKKPSLTPTATTPTPQTVVSIPPKDFRAECQLSKNEISLGDSIRAEIIIKFQEQTSKNFKVAWSKLKPQRSLDYNEAIFLVDSPNDKIVAEVTRISDGFSKTLVCPLNIDSEPVDENEDLDPCIAAKIDALNIARERELALAEHNAIAAQIQTNSNGTFGGALSSLIEAEDTRYRQIENSIYARLTTANYTVQLFCD